jgi:hypothetical protein
MIETSGRINARALALPFRFREAKAIGQLHETHGGRPAPGKYFESARLISFAAINGPKAAAGYVSRHCGMATGSHRPGKPKRPVEGIMREPDQGNPRQDHRSTRMLVLRMRTGEHIVFKAAIHRWLAAARQGQGARTGRQASGTDGLARRPRRERAAGCSRGR